MWEIAKKFLRLKTTTVEERRREIREELTNGDAIVGGMDPVDAYNKFGIF